MHPATELIKEIGIYRLCGTDGCLCMSCHVQGISVDISCRKSDAAIETPRPGFFGVKLRVHSGSMDANGPDLKEVAEEVCRQLADEGYAIAVRYCEYKYDKEQICIYCDASRADPKGYLCEECLVKPTVWGDGKVADHYDYRKYEFEVAEPAN